jgi:predicted nucleic acid-binding protein
VVNLAEVLDVLVRIYGFPLEAVAHRLDLLSAGPVAIVEADEVAGRLAGDLRSRHYRRNDTAISLADCFALATASLLDVPLATADPALARVAREEGVEVVGLPDSVGRLPA